TSSSHSVAVSVFGYNASLLRHPPTSTLFPYTTLFRSAYAPKIIKVTIPGAFIGALIGPGGKVIQELQKASGTTIVINEVNEQGEVEILGTNPDGIQMVLSKIDSIIFKPQVGETYEVKVIKMLDFGAVVEYTQAPGAEVLLHVSELAWERTENVSDVVNMGDVFEVKYMGMDPK